MSQPVYAYSARSFNFKARISDGARNRQRADSGSHDALPRGCVPCERRRRYRYLSGYGRERAGRGIVRVISRRSPRGSVERDGGYIEDRRESIGDIRVGIRVRVGVSVVLYHESVGEFSVFENGGGAYGFRDVPTPLSAT